MSMETIRLRSGATSGESVTLRRDETGALTGAEITRDGRTVLTLEITEWVME